MECNKLVPWAAEPSPAFFLSGAPLRKVSTWDSPVAEWEQEWVGWGRYGVSVTPLNHNPVGFIFPSTSSPFSAVSSSCLGSPVFSTNQGQVLESRQMETDTWHSHRKRGPCGKPRRPPLGQELMTRQSVLFWRLVFSFPCFFGRRTLTGNEVSLIKKAQ